MIPLGFSRSSNKLSCYSQEKRKQTKNEENCLGLSHYGFVEGRHLMTDALVSKVHMKELGNYEITTDTL